MARQALYRKWRPQTLGEIVGQEPIARTLANAVREDRVAHAYLFTGPRGTGKTSTARILAKAVNCVGDGDEKPCNACSLCHSITNGSCLDLIEIDAASNTSVDDVRDLRDKVHFSPNEGRYKVYIIDEVHMLSTSAFNALLKTLEEPPAHAIFVLATTEPHKIPATVLSRCQRFDFRRIPRAEIVRHLRKVASSEGLQIEAAALELIARQATGSMRDALSLLDQLISYEGVEITLERSRDVLGIASRQAIADLIDRLAEGDLAGGLTLLGEILDQGVHPRQLASEILEYLRGLLLIEAGVSHDLLNVSNEEASRMARLARDLSHARLMHAIESFNQASWDIKRGLLPQLPLELALVTATSEQREAESVVRTRPAETPGPHAAPPAAVQQAPIESKVAVPQPTSSLPMAEPAVESTAPARDEGITPSGVSESQPALNFATISEQWGAFRERIRQMGPSGRQLAALLKYGEPVAMQGNKITLGFQYPFHRDKVAEPESRRTLQEKLEEFLGQPITLEYVVTAERRTKVEPPANPFEEAARDPVVRALMDQGGRITDVKHEE